MKRAGLLLSLLLCLAVAPGLAETNSIMSDTGFGMTFDHLNDAQAHVLTLEKGDALSLSVVLSGGGVTLRILQEGGDVLYESSAVPAPGTAVDIPADGLYRVTVVGEDASGTVLVRRAIASDVAATDDRLRLERMQSPLGYVIAFEPDTFHYTPGTNGDADTFVAGTTSSLTIERRDGSQQRLADQYAQAESGAVEDVPTIIDYRAARVFRLEADGQVHDTTFIEAGRDATYVVTAIYPAEEAGMSEKMQNMIVNMTFFI